MMGESEDRRYSVDFDPVHFATRASRGEQLTPLETFRQIHHTNHWGNAESRSGPGSAGNQTAVLQAELPRLLRRFEVTTLLDLPCGDANWMSTISLPGVRYLGADLVPEVIQRNREQHPADLRFEVLDLMTSPLPSADLLLCRDCLVHLSFADVQRAMANIRRSPITWLLTTTFPAQSRNEEIVTGDWRPINLELAPFNLPQAELLLNERCTEQDGRFADKSLGLWRVSDLRGVD
jgi:SAM-dependent methyltransferase